MKMLLFNLRREFKKIKESLTSLNSQSLNNKDTIKENTDSIISNKEKIARLEGVISMLVREKSQSQSQPVSVSIKKSQGNIETKIINKVRRSKKAIVMAEINKLKDSLSGIEMYDVIVLEKGLCSKASFYRYLSILKSQSQAVSKTKQG